MTIRSSLKLALPAAGALLLAGAAQAQGVMTPGAMPPPPSFQETSTPKDTQPQKRRARKPATAEADASMDAQPAAPRRKLRNPTASTSSGETGYSGRIDTRPTPSGSGAMQLEDDPRAVTPVLNNGRAGMGMRF